jgi:O-antigen/teichoic acid export membrane protein
MRMKWVVAWNVVWIWSGTAVNMAAGFIVAPFLIRHFGDTNYGLWILISSLTGYFGLLDLGLRGAVGRHIAYYRAKEDEAGINSILSTAALFLGSAAAAAVFVTGVVVVVFPHLFAVPAEQLADVRLALVLVGLNIALQLALGIFEALLWAFQRSDLINGAQIPTTLLRLGLTFLVVGQGQGLVALAWIALLTTLLAEVAKGVASFVIYRQARFRLTYISRQSARLLLGYSVWNFIQTMSRILAGLSGSFVIGSLLTVSLVTPYSLAMRLIYYATESLAAFSHALTPVVTALHAKEHHGSQRKLFLDWGMYCLGISLYFLTLFLFLGEPFLALWVGGKLGASAAPLLYIVAVGEVLPLSQSITRGIVLGIGQPRLLALLGIAENALALPLGLALARPYGVAGVCVAFAVAATLFRGVFQLSYACRMIGVPLRRYVLEGLLPALALAVVPGLGLALFSYANPPRSWPALSAITAVYSLCYGLPWAALLGYTWLRRRERHQATSCLGSRTDPRAGGKEVGDREQPDPMAGCPLPLTAN